MKVKRSEARFPEALRKEWKNKSRQRHKAIAPLMESILLLIIALAVVGVTFQLGLPYLQRINDLKAFEQGKELILEIDGVINKIKLNEITGKEISISLNSGDLVIDDGNDFVQYELSAALGVLEEGFYTKEGNVYMKRIGNSVVGFQSDDVNIITDNGGRIDVRRGTYNLHIDYNGSYAGKIKVRFRVE